MPTHAELPLTIADLEAMPDDGSRYELIDGEIYVSTSPTFLHQSALTNILARFWIFLNQNPIGAVVPGVGIVFDDFNGVIPDAVFVTNERKEQILSGGRFTGCPEIVVEILSPGSMNERRDRQFKRKLYSSRGVHEYWIVDPETRSVEVYRKRKQGGLGSSVQLQTGDEISSTLLPGFTLPVEAIFAR